jgi:DNA-binding transcriptional regulator YdaS (Cro superfamily)
MNIRAYLKKHALSQEKFAKQIGVTQGLVSQWLNGKTKITPRWANEIEQSTSGEVSRMECLYPDEPKPRRSPERAVRT